MTTKGKKIFLILSVVVPFIIYSIIYYAPIIRNAPFKAKEFVSFEYKWGVGDRLENSYNSATGVYRYVNNNDSVVLKNIKFDTQDFNYLDSVAHVQGFWNLPGQIANGEDDLKNPKALKYYMKFNYQKKSKEVTFYPDFNGNPKLKSAAVQMQKTIEQMLNDAERKVN